MLRIITVKWGPKYPAEYANKLYRMVRRHLDIPHSAFTCLTDDPAGLECNWHEIWRTDLTGWWNKMLLFDPHAIEAGAWRLGDRLLLLDLDIVIVQSISAIAEYDSDFAMHWDFMAPRRMASAVMLLKAGSRPKLWEQFLQDRSVVTQSRYGDQAFIDKHAPDVDVFPRRWIVSYKLQARPRPPEGSRVVCFHGTPKMLDIQSGWVPKAWN